jgi:hypothetical protein
LPNAPPNAKAKSAAINIYAINIYAINIYAINIYAINVYAINVYAIKNLPAVGKEAQFVRVHLPLHSSGFID